MSGSDKPGENARREQVPPRPARLAPPGADEKNADVHEKRQDARTHRSQSDAERILAHNRAIFDGDETPSADAEAELGTGRSVGSENAQSGAARGDYSND
jgi:hypothetical protein